MRFDHIAQQVPDIGEAVDWIRQRVPDCAVLFQDASWALVEAAGARIALVLPDQHPDHLAYRVDAGALADLAAEHGQEIATHRDATRSIYLHGPGRLCLELIAYPEDER